MTYEDRDILAKKYEAYKELNPCLIDCPFNVISFLDMAGYLRDVSAVPGHVKAKERSDAERS